MHAIEAALKKARNTGTPFSFPVDKQLEEQLRRMTLATPEELAAMKPFNSHASPKKSTTGPPPKPRKGGSRRRSRGRGRKTRSNRG
jgi:hypothetical protein